MNRDPSIRSLDRGVKKPLLYNLLAAALTILLTFLHLIIVSRTLSESDLVLYGSITTFFNILGLLVSRHLQWGARILVRMGGEAVDGYIGINTLAVLIGLAISPLFIHLFIAPLDAQLAIIIILYSIVVTYFYSFIQIVNIVATKYYTFIFMLNYFGRVILLVTVISQASRLDAYYALYSDILGISISLLAIAAILRSVFPLRLFLLGSIDIGLSTRTFRLAVPQFLLLPRINIPNIHYFIVFFLRIPEVIINSLWVVYRMLSWGRSFFRGFFSVIYSKQFYGELDERVFREYIDFILYLITPVLLYSTYLHIPIVSIFNPGFTPFSYLVPLAILLLLLDIIRISMIRIVFGGDTVDIDDDSVGIPKGIFYRVALLEAKLFAIFILPAISVSYLLATLGLGDLVPPLLLGLFTLQLVLEVYLIYRIVNSRWGFSYRSFNPLYFISASLPGLIYLISVDAGGVVVKDIFVEGPILVAHLSMAMSIYILSSLTIPWVRRHITSLLGLKSVTS